MAGALVGGAFLSAFLQVAFDRLASRDFRDFLKGRKDIDGSLKKLKMLLRSANVVLVDAEDNQYTNPDVKEWLDELQDAVYDADDLLDEIALRCKLQAESQTGTSEVRNFITVFGVGIHDDGSSIKELGELQHLSGKLSLLNLENVQCINKDTTEVILKNKQDLSELKLEWKYGHGAKDSEKEKILLEQLCPCTNLNSLTITNYEGTNFPKWLGDSSFSKMVSMELRNCDNCFSLPPLGQLPNLKNLKIKCFGKISRVGPEFYGKTNKPFRALECLSFKDMPEWQEWVLIQGEVFTSLRALYIKDCPKLSGGLPVQLPSLTRLDISFVSLLCL